MASVSKQAVITGKVQGVWFRKSTQDAAVKLHINGWVRNLADGRVEVLMVGNAENMHRFESFLGEGPPLSRVDKVEFVAVEGGAPEGFEIR